MVITLVIVSLLVLLMVNKFVDEEAIVAIAESVFDESRNLMVFESHSTTRYCLNRAYLNIIPEHVTIYEMNHLYMLEDILQLAKSDLLGYISGHYLLGAKFTEGKNDTVVANALYFQSLYEEEFSALEIASLSLVHNAVLKGCQNLPRAILVKVDVTDVHEEREQSSVKDYDLAITYLQNALAAVLLTIGLSLVCCCFVFLTTHEQVTQSKHLQLMTGTNILLFWATAFLFDFLFYLACISVYLGILIIFAGGSVIGAPQVPGLMFIGMLLFGFSAIPFSYVASVRTKSVSAAYIVTLVVHIVSAVIFAIIHESIFMFMRMHNEPVPEVMLIISMMVNLLPGCCVAVIFIRVWLIALLELSQKNCYNFCAEYLDIGNGGVAHLLSLLAFSGFIYISLLFLLELRSPIYGYRICFCFRKPKNESVPPRGDKDVREEYDRVTYWLQRRKTKRASEESSASSEAEDVLLVDGLTKKFSSKTMTVDELTFGVGEDECFGLLGVNGAGKTTTFRMLTGSLTVSSGNAYLQDCDLTDSRQKFLSKVGYCPQFDAVLDHLTARETLLLFANLRGVQRKQTKTLVNYYLHQFGLSDYAYKITANYSLGTKRRLSAAVAFLGVPALVMMDEPTTGVDPASKRKIWQVILSYISRGTSIILTSHSMDECEVLCTRLAIMKKGRLKCIGAVQHLKAKFGKGFKVYIKLPKSADPQQAISVHDKVEDFMVKTFKSCVKRDDHEGLLEYSVPYESTNWEKLFSMMEKARDKFKLDDYSVCQATLEQVFLRFASDDEPLDENSNIMSRMK